MSAGVKKLGEWGKTPDGKSIERWELNNGRGLRAEVLNLGGIVLRLQTPDRLGKSADILLSPRDVATVFGAGWPYLGALIGRFGNRIGFGRFTVDGQPYSLATNDAPHSLHGGKVGYDRRLWEVSPVQNTDGASVKLSLVDADGTEGYPGTVNVSATYTLTQAGAWRIEYVAVTDKPTPINLTQHAYFNLKDAGRSKIVDHEMRLTCSHYTPADAQLIPTGHIAPVAGTPFDFTSGKSIKRGFSKLHNHPVGFDHNFVIDGAPGELRQAAEVYEPVTGRVMQLWSTEPGVQFYTANFLDGSLVGIDGFVYEQHTAFCLETQHYPDSPNQPNFPGTILRPGQTYRQTTEYRFSVR